jgi:hypothetical protein
VIANRDTRLVHSDENKAEIEIRNDWLIQEKIELDELTSVGVREQDGAYLLDLEYRLTPVTDMVLNHTAFGGFCVRARNDGDSWYTSPRGTVDLRDPHYSVPELNWPDADWYDFTIRLRSGETVGVAVIDHPQNPPATWHNPRYVWMVNPCIVAEKAVTVKGGETLTLRYLVVVHDGPTPTKLLEKLSSEWK